MKNYLKYLVSLTLVGGIYSSSIVFGSVCPGNQELFTKGSYELKLVEVENNNSNFMKKILQEVKVNSSKLNKEKNSILQELEKIQREITEGVYGQNAGTSTLLQSKISLLSNYGTNFDSKYTAFKNQYLNIDYVGKLRSGDNDDYIETSEIFLQTSNSNTVRRNNISCIKTTLLGEIEGQYKELEVNVTILKALLSDIKTILSDKKESTVDGSSLETYYQGLLDSISTSGIVGGGNLTNKSFLKLENDNKKYIQTNIDLQGLTGKTYLEGILTHGVDPIQLIGNIPSIKEISSQTFDVVKNQNGISYGGYLKYKINVFKDTVMSFGGSETIDLKKGSGYLVIWYDLDNASWKVGYFDEKGREQEVHNFSTSSNISFNEFVGFVSFNGRVISENLSQDFQNQIRGYLSSLGTTNLIHDGKVLPILENGKDINTEITKNQIVYNNIQSRNSISKTGKIISKNLGNNGVKFSINISPSLLRYFKDGAFDSIDDIGKLINIYGDGNSLSDSENYDTFLQLLTKPFDGQTILGGTGNLNTGSLYSNTENNRIIVQRNLQNGGIQLDGSLREYWLIDPNYQGDNNGKKYARGMIIVIGKMISLKKDSQGNITGGDMYLFPLIDQDWGTVINIGNLTKSFNETSKIGSCGKTSYTCGGITIEAGREYQQQKITSFLSNVSKSSGTNSCQVSQQEFECLKKKIDSPTTVIIGDNRKGLQDILMMKFTLDLTQTRIEDAIQYKFITSVPQYGDKVLKIRRGKTDSNGQKIYHYIKSIQNEEEMNHVKNNFAGKYLTNLIVTTNENDFEKNLIGEDKKKNGWLKTTASGLLTTEQLKSFFGIGQI